MLNREQFDAEVSIALEVEQEWMDVRGNAMATDEPELDKQYEDEIIARLDSGDVWAWASVIVKATWGPLEGTDSLGGCSYKDEADFIANSGYYDDMVQNAKDECWREVQRLQSKICDCVEVGAN